MNWYGVGSLVIFSKRIPLSRYFMSPGRNDILWERNYGIIKEVFFQILHPLRGFRMTKVNCGIMMGLFFLD